MVEQLQSWKLPVTVHFIRDPESIQGYIICEGSPETTLEIPATVWQQPHRNGPVFFVMKQDTSFGLRMITVNASEILTVVVRNAEVTPYED